MTHLKTLELAGIALESLSDDLISLTALTKLNLGFNRFKLVPAILAKMPQLEELQLDNNSISQLNADELLQLTALRVLDLNCNDLTDLPPRLGLLTALRRLDVEGNAIKSIKRSTIEAGCIEILRCLRDRIPQAI